MSITVRNLTKLYGEEKAIDDISFDVKTGEILGFLGPNGAGKTTTMKIITCYMPPSAGTVTVNGYDIAKNSLDVTTQDRIFAGVESALSRHECSGISRIFRSTP